MRDDFFPCIQAPSIIGSTLFFSEMSQGRFSGVYTVEPLKILEQACSIHLIQMPAQVQRTRL